MKTLHMLSDLSEAPAARSSGRLALFCCLFLLLLCCRGSAQTFLCTGRIRIDSLGDGCFRFVAGGPNASRRLRVVPLDSGAVVRGLSFLYERYSLWKKVTPDSAEWVVPPLGNPEIAAGYLCFNTSRTPLRLAVTLMDSIGGVICSDTINIASDLRRDRCVEVEGMDVYCIYLADGGGGIRTLAFSIRNRTSRPLHSISIIDPDMRDVPAESWFRPPVPSGERGGSNVYFSSISRTSPMRMQITVCDSAGTGCCTDTVMVIAPLCGSPSSVPKDPVVRRARAVLEEISPNPAATFVAIRFSLAAGERGVHLTITDATGRMVGRILSGAVLSLGSHSYTFDTSLLPPGIYFVTLSMGEHLSAGSFQVVR